MSLATLTLLLSGAAIGLSPLWFKFVLHYLPDSQGLPTGISEGLTFAVEKINSFSFIFPISDLVIILKWLVIFEIVMLGLKATMAFIRFIRGTA